MASAAEANARALALRAQGEQLAAIAALRAAIADFPADRALRLNLAFVLGEQGDVDAALAAYDDVLRLDPHDREAHVAQGLLLFARARNAEARTALERALETDPGDVRANLAMFELLHVLGDPAAAVAYQRRALDRQALYSAFAAGEERSVLVLCAPGDLQANIPVDFLFDARTTSVHKLYLVDEAGLRRASVPRYDVVLNAIAESPESDVPLALAAAFCARQERPVLNAPRRVPATARDRLPHALAGIGARLAPIVRVSRAQLAAAAPLAFPVIVRPVGSHAGHGLERLDEPAEVEGYLERTAGDAFYVSGFVDYRSADGHYRKYRIICVDGEPYPCHLAISPHWMIHYYNAPMAENAWMRDEEERFLADIAAVFPAPALRSLRAIASALALEYVGIDCALGDDGTVLVFEADPAMVVHVSDPVALYPYKQRYVPRIFRAVEAMIDRRIPTGRAARS